MLVPALGGQLTRATVLAKRRFPGMSHDTTLARPSRRAVRPSFPGPPPPVCLSHERTACCHLEISPGVCPTCCRSAGTPRSSGASRTGAIGPRRSPCFLVCSLLTSPDALPAPVGLVWGRQCA